MYKVYRSIEVENALSLAKNEEAFRISLFILREKHPQLPIPDSFDQLEQDTNTECDESLLGLIRNPKTKAKFYLKICKICANDVQLHGLGVYIIAQSSYLNSIIPCGCSEIPKWTRYQYIIRIERKISKTGKKLLSIPTGIIKSNTYKPTLVCEHHPDELMNSATINGILFGSNGTNDGCVKCGNERKKQYHRESNNGLENHINEIMNTGKFHPKTTFKRSDTVNDYGRFSKLVYSCPICANDEYTKNGLCTGEFEQEMHTLKQGHLSCRCTGGFRWTKEQREYQIKKELCNRSTDEVIFTFIGWDGEYTNSRSVFLYSRSDSSIQQKINIADFFSFEYGFSMYNEYGFKKNKPTRSYMNVDQTNESDKFGISQQGNSINPRLKKINKSFLEEYGVDNFWTNVLVIFFHTEEGGFLASELETQVHTVALCGKPHKNIGYYKRGDGYTETYNNIHRQNVIEVIKQFLAKHEGKYIIERDINGIFGEVIL